MTDGPLGEEERLMKPLSLLASYYLTRPAQQQARISIELLSLSVHSDW